MPTDLKLPFSPDAGRCYRDLPKLGAGYQQGFKAFVAQASAPGTFAERFGKAIALHGKTIEAGRAAPSGPLMEEDVYLCCVYDALNAWVGQEAKQVVEAKASPEVTQKGLDALLGAIDALPWASPKWNSIEKPRLKSRVTEAQHRP